MHHVIFLLILFSISCKYDDSLWYNGSGGNEMSDKEALVVPGMKLRITPSDNASSRTRNRIRERGEHGFVLKNRSPCAALHNRPSMCLMGQEPGKLAGDQWLGWLPEDEIEFEQWVEERT